MIRAVLELIRSLFVYSPVRDWDALMAHPDGTLTRDQDNGSGLAPMIARLEQERAACVDFVERTVAQAHAETRDLSDTEEETLGTQRKRIQDLDKQLAPMREFAELQGAHRASGAGFQPTGPASGQQTGGQSAAAQTQPRAYEYRTMGEVMADAARATARDQDLPPGMGEQMRQAARSRLEGAGLTLEGGSLARLEGRADQTTADTPGIMPENIVGQVIKDVDAARPFISSVGAKPLAGVPGKTFHRPVVTQSTQVGEQTGGEKTELPSRKMVIGDVDFTKRTFGGWVNISRQDIDWTSPSAWDAVLTDLQEQYALETENAAADDFATSVSGTTALGTSTTFAAMTTDELLVALFTAASATYGVAKRLPDHIWASLDMWAVLGPKLAALRANGSGLGVGDASVQSFTGNLLGISETVVPSFATGTLIIGNSNRVEVYEDRIGLLSVVEPKILGVEVAYGGYLANGTLKAGAFRKIVVHP